MSLNMTLAELKKLLEKKQGMLEKLYSKREKLAAKLEAVDAAIAEIAGGAPGKRRGRGRKARAEGTAAPAEGAKAAEQKTRRKRGRPRRTETIEPAVVQAVSATAASPGPAPLEPAAPAGEPAKKSGPRLADLMAKVLDSAPGREMSAVQLAIEVEKLGYVSKNTEQVIRLTSGRGGRFNKTEEDMIQLISWT